MRYISLLALVSLLAACGGSDASVDDSSSDSAYTSAPVAPPANFEKVRDGIYRGGHPDPGGVKYLKSLGIRTIVDLEIDDLIEATPKVIAEEVFDAWKASIPLERYPMSAFSLAVSDEFDARIAAILTTLKDDSKKPIYVHCKHGQDRTGLVIGLERVLVEGWTAQAAHDEMVRIGFHPELLGLEEYFERKTGSVLP
jgi:protein tyrosine/serine phosphatase